MNTVQHLLSPRLKPAESEDKEIIIRVQYGKCHNTVIRKRDTCNWSMQSILAQVHGEADTEACLDMPEVYWGK